ncbi:hypothetical protein EX30DRAFT_373160 [Ascodesmis nigricans]|uniref:Fungal N-terminal domain-containing protein n=1 Tax=Ascodesmis nigricans TaxID=341454 RepID=A0A4S2MQB6_9PEZI|nr:hypothetical protein EX30DRAFT_373160 [Ascodesmis nigricans]
MLSPTDIIAGAKFLHTLYTTCFTNVSNTKLAYFTFGEQVRGLADQLETLWHVLSEHELRQQRRLLHQQQQQQGGGARASSAATANVDMRALAAMVGDFQRTIAAAQELLSTGEVFRRGGGYVTKIRWTFNAEEQVVKVTQDMQFHMTKIQFVVKTLELRFLGQISDQIDEAHASLMSRLHDLEDRLLTALGSTRTTHLPVPPPPTYQASERLGQLATHDRVTSRFEDSLRHHPRFRSILHEIPLEDWTEAAAWWIERGKCVVVRSHEVPADLYLNLLKAAWLLRKVEGTIGFQRLERNSMWIEYICTLSEAIINELATLTSPSLHLALPDEDTILRLPKEMFHVWLNTAPTESILTIHDERPGEEKLVELPLATSLDPDRFSRKLLVFRKDLGSLRLCDSTENLENGSRSAEEFVVVSAETQLLALYVTAPMTYRQTPNYSVMLRNRLQSREYTFLSQQDLFTFQRALTAAQIIFTLPTPSTLISATRSSTLTAHCSALQIWNPKPLSRFTSSSSSASVDDNSTIARAPTAHSITSTTSSTSSSVGETTNIISLTLPKPPQLVLYVYTPAAGWQMLVVPLDENVVVAGERCCGKRLTHRLQAKSSSSSSSSTASSVARRFSFALSSSSSQQSKSPPAFAPQQQQRQHDDQPLCCLRTVLEPKHGSIDAVLYDHVDGGEMDLLQVSAGGKAGKKVGYRYVALEFAGEEDKRRVERAVGMVEVLRRKVRGRVLGGVGRGG